MSFSRSGHNNKYFNHNYRAWMIYRLTGFWTQSCQSWHNREASCTKFNQSIRPKNVTWLLWATLNGRFCIWVATLWWLFNKTKTTKLEWFIEQVPVFCNSYFPLDLAGFQTDLTLTRFSERRRRSADIRILFISFFLNVHSFDVNQLAKNITSL